MNIYIKLEILAREFESRLLLAMVAAERGHDVLVGDLSALLSHRLWLPPGIYHDKSLTPKPSKIALHRRLANAGFVVTSQDEESGLKQPDYLPFARRRFSSGTLAIASAAFAWGPHDNSALREAYAESAERIRMTGSPRVDLWRPELRGLHGNVRNDPLVGIDPDRPLVLIAPGSIPFRPNDFWTMIHDARPRQFAGADDPREWSLYTTHAMAFAYMGRLVRAVRILADALPDTQIIVRPHPKSANGAWEAVLGPIAPNVAVRRDGSSGRWISAADALVHNGSTTGVEAAAGGVTVVSFQPNGEGADLFPNRVGKVAHDEDELIAVLRQVTAAGGRPAVSPEVLDVLEERFAALDGPLAADRIVDVWEENDSRDRCHPNRIRRAMRVSESHRRAGLVRARTRRFARRMDLDGPILDVDGKFPPVRRNTVIRTATGLRQSLDRFYDVKVEQVGPRLIHVHPQTGESR